MDNPVPLNRRPFYKTTEFWFWGMVAVALSAWFIIRVQQIGNFDVLWLSEALQRILRGGRMSDVAYELNPPLSMLIYILPVLANMALPGSLDILLFLQTTVIVAFAGFAMFRILEAWSLLERDSLTILLAAFLLFGTIGAELDFGERDHLTGICLVPFTLLQLSLTYNRPRPKGWTWPVLIIGTIFILVKPHDGLLPGLLILHRIIHKKNLSALRDIDTLSLVAGSVFYIALVLLAFPDYVSVILPDAMKLYALRFRWDDLYYSGFLMLAAISVLIPFVFLVPAQDAEKRTRIFFFAAACICMLSYISQGKGFTYQRLPVYLFLIPAAALCAVDRLKLRYSGGAALLICLMVMLATLFFFCPLNPDFPRRSDYAGLPLAKLLQDECPKDRQCRFFMYNKDMGIMHEAAHYTDTVYASRFPSVWYMPGLVADGRSGKDVHDLYLKYAGMVTEDLATGKPDIAILWRPKDMADSFYLDYFKDYPPFVAEWQKYKKLKSIDLSYAEYYRGTPHRTKTLTYDVYLRN